MPPTASMIDILLLIAMKEPYIAAHKGGRAKGRTMSFTLCR
jgi:hypothetical protein